MHSEFTAENWRARAAEARAKAEHMSDPEAKAAMLQAAEIYEELAERAKESGNVDEEQQATQG
jgi:hypothetical protein